MTIETMKQFAAKGRSLVNHSAKARDILQEMLVFAIRQAHEHKNGTPATQLATKFLPDSGLRRKDALQYLIDHAPLRWDSKAETFKYAKARKVGSVADAERTRWYEYARQGNDNPPAFDPMKDLRNTLSTLERHKKAAEDHGATGLAELYGKMLAEATRELEALKAQAKAAETAATAEAAENKAAIKAH